MMRESREIHGFTLKYLVRGSSMFMHRGFRENAVKTVKLHLTSLCSYSFMMRESREIYRTVLFKLLFTWPMNINANTIIKYFNILVA